MSFLRVRGTGYVCVLRVIGINVSTTRAEHRLRVCVLRVISVHVFPARAGHRLCVCVACNWYKCLYYAYRAQATCFLQYP